MTIWQPNIDAFAGPKYRAIAEALAADIAAGRLQAGARLPTHRDLAWRLGVTVGTVTRAYALARDRGLISGQVGRGTVVEAPGATAASSPAADFAWYLPGPRDERPDPAPRHGIIEMVQNVCAVPGIGEILAEGLRRIADPAALDAAARYHGPGGMEAHREAGAAWLRRSGLAADTGSVFVVSGAQHGLATAFMALTTPGDTVVVEPLTWSGARNLASMLGLRLHAAEMDEYGIVPEAFETACRVERPKLLYTIPTLQNPTSAIMPEDRRRRLAAIARAHDVVIVEDDVFGFLAADAPPPIAATDPDVTVHVASLSKAVTPILRIGFLYAPDRLHPRIESVIRATAIMASPITGQLAAELVHSGAADAMVRAARQLAAERQRLARRVLGAAVGSTRDSASHVWLPLPAAWRGAEFAATALAQGVAITAGNAFVALPGGEDPGHVRLTLCAEPDAARVQKGLEVVAGLLAAGPGGATSVI